MSTQNYSTTIEHSSDATFRAWALELSNALTTVGLIKTSDTGQITIASATMPGTSTAAGYEIRQMNDSLQSTAPIYVKIEYGTTSAAGRPGVWVTVGTATNGSGTLSNIIMTRTMLSAATAITSTSTNYPSWLCRVDGFFGMATKVGYSSTTLPTLGTLVVQRTVDSSGSPTADGAMVVVSTTATAVKAASRNFTTGFTTGENAFFCLVPYSMTSSLVSGGPQVFGNVAALPRISTLIGTVTVLSSEVSLGTQFQATPVGVTQRNYLSIGAAGAGASANNNAAHTLAFLWE